MTYERTSFYSGYLGRVVTVVTENGTVYGLTLDELQRQEQAGRATAITRACQAYLAGENADLQEYPVHLSDLSPFACAVLTLTRQIPRGHVTTYSALAARIGRPHATRAVGNALAKNPIPLFVPCHRVIGTDGIGGFSCGPDVKVKLLQLEGISLS